MQVRTKKNMTQFLKKNELFPLKKRKGIASSGKKTLYKKNNGTILIRILK